MTNTVIGLEITTFPCPELSATWNSKVHAPGVERAEVEMVAGEAHEATLPKLLKTVAPGASTSH